MLDSRFRLPYGSGQSEIPTRAVPFARPDYRKWRIYGLSDTKQDLQNGLKRLKVTLESPEV